MPSWKIPVAAAATAVQLLGGSSTVGADVTVNPQAWVLPQADLANASALPFIHWPEDDLDDMAGRPKTAVAFSGGGTRAAIAAFGYLRGLVDLGLVPKIRSEMDNGCACGDVVGCGVVWCCIMRVCVVTRLTVVLEY